MAAVLYETLSGGHKPPDATDRVMTDPLVPLSQFIRVAPGLEETVAAGLRVDGAKRPQSVDAWRALLPQTLSSPDSSPRHSPITAAADDNKTPGLPSNRLERSVPLRNTPHGDTYADARLLIADSRIAEGRALLLRLASNGDAMADACHTALCFDLLRPPAEPKRATEFRILLGPAESQAIASLQAFARGDDAAALEHITTACENPVLSDFGMFVILVSLLAASHRVVTQRILAGTGRAAAPGAVIAPAFGVARLLERRHEEAWRMFTSGADDPSSSLDMVKDPLGRAPGDGFEPDIVRMITAYCDLGKGLVLYDLAFAAEAKPYFAAAAPILAGMLKPASRLLSIVSLGLT